MKQLFIPEKLKIGFKNRSNTYTGKLAYVIYYDQTGKLRKETSWQNWRDRKIEPLDISNEPTEGFVLNKGVGGARQSYGWNVRNEYIRIYDPRDFEFEISVANLLFILRECDCSRGKGLEGKFVYAWDGTSLVLLPVNCEDYKNSINFTKLQAKNIAVKDLLVGRPYLTKKQEVLVYLGRFDYFNKIKKNIIRYAGAKIGKKHIFYHEKNDLFVIPNIKSIASLQNDVEVSNYAELVQKYYKSVNGSKPIRLFLKKEEEKANTYWDYRYIQNNNREFIRYSKSNYGNFVKLNTVFGIDDKGIYYYKSSNPIRETVSNIEDELWVEHESGSTFKFDSNYGWY